MKKQPEAKVNKRMEESIYVKSKKINFDEKTHRRVLNFLNQARTPEELVFVHRDKNMYMSQPVMKRPDTDEPSQEKMPKQLINIEQARHILKERDKVSPVYGFAHIDQLRDKIDITKFTRYFDHLSFSLSALTFGEWNDIGPIQTTAGENIQVVHAAMLHTGKVLFIEAACNIPVSRTPLWNAMNRATVEITVPAPPTDNLYCSGHSFLSDGKLLVVGGGGENGQTPNPNFGWMFDPDTETWAFTRDTSGNRTFMNFSRWYPTLVSLGDEPGRVLIASGDQAGLSAEFGGPLPATPMPMEIYSESTGTFTQVTSSANKYFCATFPGLHLLPGGEIFYAPVGFRSGGSSPVDDPHNEPSGFFDFDNANNLAGHWTDLGPNDRKKGMSALLLSPTYPYAQVIIVGGGNLAKSRTYQTINLSNLSPSWEPQVNLPLAAGQIQPTSRVNVNLVLLPDSTVFVSGGAAAGEPTWIFNPLTQAWSEMDAAPIERKYHSHALLLPTGEVMSCGWMNNTIEVFSPPYMFRTRPVISASPSLVHHGHQFTIDTPDASSIRKVVLVRPMAPTHNTDSEQKVIQLLFSQTGANTVSATMPNGWHPHSTGQRGYYMLFILNDEGTPSVANWIYLH